MVLKLKEKNKYLINLFLILSFTVLALWFAMKDHYQEILSLIAGMKWYWLLVILFWGVLYNVIAGWIVAIFGKHYKKDYRFIDGVINGFVGTFFSGITPSATGGQFAQAYILKKQGIKVSDGASLLWTDFIVYQTTLMIYVSFLYLLRFTHYTDMMGVFFVLILFGYFVNICVIGALWTLALFPRVYVKLSHLAIRLLSRIKVVKNPEKMIQTWTLQLEAFTVQIKAMKHEKKMILKAVAINVLRLTILYVLPFITIKALGIDISFDLLIDTIAISSFVSMANAFIPIPGASGGTELVFTQLFIPIVGGGVNASSVMILWRFSTYHFVMLVGGLIFVYVKRKYDLEKTTIHLSDRRKEYL